MARQISATVAVDSEQCGLKPYTLCITENQGSGCLCVILQTEIRNAVFGSSLVGQTVIINSNPRVEIDLKGYLCVCFL